MEEKKEHASVNPKLFEEVKLELNLGELNPLDGDGVHILCSNSSEFVIGTQTSFNAPVTIINCPEGDLKSQNPMPTRENIIIRDRVLSMSAAQKIQEMAQDAPKKTEPKVSEKKFWELLHETVVKGQYSKSFAVWAIVFVGLILAAAITLAVILVKPQIPERTEPFFINHTANNSFVFTKEDWGGEPATSFIELKLPIPFVIISHSATPKCFDLATCSVLLYNMQSYHFSQGNTDISYNFLVDSSGNIYEGRGWNRISGKKPFIYTKSIVINFIGDYSRDVEPSQNQQEGVKALIDYGVENGKISKDYFLIPANATVPTLSPGKQVYKRIKNWPHFQPDYRLHIKI